MHPCQEDLRRLFRLARAGTKGEWHRLGNEFFPGLKSVEIRINARFHGVSNISQTKMRWPFPHSVASCHMNALELGPTMKSKRNLTRFTYENTAFQGWRLCVSRGGVTFTKYFSDKQYGGGKKALEAAEKTLSDLKSLLEGSKRVNGRLSNVTVKKAEKMLGAP